MTTEEQAAQAAAEAAKKATDEAAAKAAADEAEKANKDPAVLQAKYERTVAEEKKARERAQKAESELAKRAAEDEEKAKKLLEEQGKHKELYETEAKARKELAEKVARYEAGQRARADAALQAIPEHLRAFAPADPEKAEEYARTVQASLTPGAPPPLPKPPGSTPAVPPPPPPAGGGAGPSFPKQAFETLAYLGKREAPERAAAQKAVDEWKQWKQQHPGA